MIKTKASILGLALAVMSSQVLAGTTSANFQAAATMNATCELSATGINFGELASPTPVVNGSINILCSNGVVYSKDLTGGNDNPININRRLMNDAGDDWIFYDLYKDARAVTRLINSPSSSIGTGTGTGLTQTQKIYAKIMGPIYVTPGNYSEDLTITVTY